MAVIGSGAADDYVIQPSAHAERYARAAPELTPLLRSSTVATVARRYEERDGDALAAQAQFRQASRRARAAVLVTGVAAALILAAGGLATVLNDAASSALLVGFALLGVVAGALASYWIRRIRDGRMLEKWMTRRAEAETERLRYFELVTRGASTGAPLLQLEYFRRYQHDVQRAFYHRRGADHEAFAERALGRSSLGMAAAATASGAAGILGAMFDPAVSALAAVGLVAQAWAAAVENGEATDQHRRNAERYGRTLTALDGLYGMLDQVRAAVAAGDGRALDAYVAAVHDQVSLEHRQWLEETGAASAAVSRLTELLETYRGDQ
jgi:hypothetical protein